MTEKKNENPDGKPDASKPGLMDRRKRLGLLGAGTAAAILALFGGSAPARAQNTPCSDDPACADLLMDKYRSPIEFAVEELKLMQKTQEKLYEFFINPSFLMYIEMTGKQKVVDEALKLAIQYPGELHYRDPEDPEGKKERGEELPGELLITTRPAAKHIPAGFSIKIERTQITEVKLPGKSLVRLHPDGWRDWKDLRKVIAETTQYLWDNSAVFEVLTKRDLLEIDYYNFKLPHRLKELVELRNQGTKLKPEENIGNLPAYQAFITRLADHPTSYEEMQNANAGPTLYVHVEQNRPGFIEIWDPSDASIAPLMYFTYEGYIAGIVNGFDPDLSSGYTNAISNRQKAAQSTP